MLIYTTKVADLLVVFLLGSHDQPSLILNLSELDLKLLGIVSNNIHVVITNIDCTVQFECIFVTFSVIEENYISHHAHYVQHENNKMHRQHRLHTKFAYFSLNFALLVLKTTCREVKVWEVHSSPLTLKPQKQQRRGFQ